MKKLILILLLMPLIIFCQDDIPEWEKIDYDSFSSFSEVKIVSNHRNELFGILPTGVFKSTNQGDNWNRLNMPDFIVYDQIFINKNIIAAYGFSYSDYKQFEGNLVISKDNGNSWKTYPFIYGIEEDSLYQYWNQSILTIDDFGNFWGRYHEQVDDSIGLYTYINKLFVFNIELDEKIQKFEINGRYEFQNMIIEDSTIFACYTIYTDFDHLLYIIHSSNLGQSWDTLQSDDKGTPYFEMNTRKKYRGGTIVYSDGKLYLELDDADMIINIKNRTYEYITYEGHRDPYKIIKINDAKFYSLIRDDGNFNFLIRRSRDTMKTWENITFNLYDIADIISSTSISIDSNDNVYLGGIYRLLSGDSIWTYVNNTNLQYLESAYLQVNTKSEILAFPLSYPSLLYYKNNEWLTPNWNICGIRIPESDIRFLPNDNILVYSSCGLINTKYPFDEYSYYISNDSLIISDVWNWFDYQQDKYIGTGYVLRNNDEKIEYYAFSRNNCETWEILNNFTRPEGPSNLIINKNEEFILFGDSARIYISTDKGTTWKIVHDESSKTTDYDKIYWPGAHSAAYSFNQLTGVGYVIYYNPSSLLITRDNGQTWSSYDTWDEPLEPNIDLLFYSHYYSKSPFSIYSPGLIPDNTTGYFYAATFGGVYRSTDSLRSFHCISKGQVEPSVITSLFLGYDGRLYAVNYNGFWRTKNKVTSVENDTKPDFSNSDIFIYPNPADDFITIQTSEVLKTSEGYRVQIFDILGIEVMSESIHPLTQSHRMNIEGLPAGVYFIKIGNKAAKFVKM
ncbi:MAG: T9SS type A sorting domain-containing protein [Candidatus Kapabacteria bacterium]|nr:T9SS type A sorting domain-containing protein [Candidatus Kapabacteria bacterium]